MGKYDAGWLHTDQIILIYHFSERAPAVEDFVAFLDDFDKFYDNYVDDYDIKGAYLITYGEYDKKALRLLLKNTDKELRNLTKVRVLKEKITTAKKKPKTKAKEEKKVFIVHGRNKTPALQLSRIIEKRFPIETIFLEEKPHRGRTLIEKLEDYSGVDFAFITLTPDDIGALKGKPLRDRARQNVIFELGRFIGKIGREKVCLLIKGDVEIPSDLSGIGYYRFTRNVSELFLQIEGELKETRLI